MSYLIAFGVLVGLSFLWFFTFKYTCLAGIFIVFMTALIFINEFRLKILKRKCFANCYLNKKSFFYRLFQSKILVFIVSFLSSIVFSLAYSIFIINIEFSDIIFLFLSLGISYFVYEQFIKNNIFSLEIKGLFAIDFASFLAAFLAAFLLMLYKFNFLAIPSYIDVSLVKTLENVSFSYSNCEWFNFVFEFLKEIEALEWWGIVKFSVANENFYIKLFIWILFLFSNLLSFIGANKIFLNLSYFIKEKGWK